MNSMPLQGCIEQETTIQPEGPSSDEHIVRMVRNGRTNDFEILVRRYNQRLFRIIRAYLDNDEDTKDVLQTSYLKAFTHLQQFRQEAKFSTWLIRIAINEALKVVKQKARTPALYTVNAVTEEEPEHQIAEQGITTPESMAIQKDIKSILERAIGHLPEYYRIIFVLREIEQLSTKETAEMLNLSVVNVKVRLYRAKKMLQKELVSLADYSMLFTFDGADCDIMTQQVMRAVRQKACSS